MCVGGEQYLLQAAEGAEVEIQVFRREIEAARQLLDCLFEAHQCLPQRFGLVRGERGVVSAERPAGTVGAAITVELPFAR